jgi:hypothetical protein
MEGRRPEEPMRLKFWPAALVPAAVLVSGWRTDASSEGLSDERTAERYLL